MPHGLHLLVLDDGEVGNLDGLGPSTLSQCGGSHPLAKQLRDSTVTQTLGTTKTS